MLSTVVLGTGPRETEEKLDGGGGEFSWEMVDHRRPRRRDSGGFVGTKPRRIGDQDVSF